MWSITVNFTFERGVVERERGVVERERRGAKVLVVLMTRGFNSGPFLAVEARRRRRRIGRYMF